MDLDDEVLCDILDEASNPPTPKGAVEEARKKFEGVPPSPSKATSVGSFFSGLFSKSPQKPPARRAAANRLERWNTAPEGPLGLIQPDGIKAGALYAGNPVEQGERMSASRQIAWLDSPEIVERRAEEEKRAAEAEALAIAHARLAASKASMLRKSFSDLSPSTILNSQGTASPTFTGPSTPTIGVAEGGANGHSPFSLSPHVSISPAVAVPRVKI